MLDYSEVPIIDSNISITTYKGITGRKIIKLDDRVSMSTLYIPESDFNKTFKAIKKIVANLGEHRGKFLSARGHEWVRFKDIDRVLFCECYDYFMVDRIPIYVEMLKHIKKCKVYLDRESLLSQRIEVLEAVNKKIKRRKKLYKIEDSKYITI